MTSLKYIA